MFAFKIWGKFACFRDPLGISQNITLPIPPKTAVSGMLAALLGKEEYLNDEEFCEFKYSVVLDGEIIKKTFSQNYINDYTKLTKTHLNSLLKFDMQKISSGLRDSKTPQKPINRELLINPRYIIFVKDFKLENEAMHNLKNRICKFAFYLGNSEFAGNFEFLPMDEVKILDSDEVCIDSFLQEDEVSQLVFENGTLYSPISFTAKLDNSRSPQASVNLIIANKPMKLKNTKAYEIHSGSEIYRCKFV